MSILFQVFVWTFLCIFTIAMATVLALEGKNVFSGKSLHWWGFSFVFSAGTSLFSTVFFWAALSADSKYIHNAKTPKAAFAVMEELDISYRRTLWKYSCYSRDNETKESCDTALTKYLASVERGAEEK